MRAAVDRAGVAPDAVDDVLWGCVDQIGAQSTNIARTGWLAGGLPDSVPGTTIDRQCGSSQQAAAFAAQGVMAGQYDIVIACGVESMSRVPLGSSTGGMNPYGKRMAARYPDGLVSQGVSAELIAKKWCLDRHTLDSFSARSHRMAIRATERGDFISEIVPVGEVRRDETIRETTTVDGLAGLKPAFRTDALAARFPELDWQITAGNSSPLTDGASAALIMSAERAKALRLTPRARFVSFAVTGSDPLYMLTGVIPATRKALERASLTIDDMDAYEVNEAFASVPLAWQHDLNADPDKLNPWGGAIALGHALGSSGTRLLATLVNYLESTRGRYGLQTMCEGGGMANATVIERIRP
jgi:acetyl-CoA acetyltransferase family protein